MTTRGGRILENLIKISVGVFATLSIFFFPSFVKVFPLLQIKHLAVNSNNPKLIGLINSILHKEFSNNYLFLSLNKIKFENILREKTDYYIERVEKIDFNWENGNLILKLKKNKPVAVLNNKFLISKNGRIFGFEKEKPKVKIFDKTSVWNYGDIYKGIELSEVGKFNRFYVGEFNYIAENGKVKLLLPKGSIKEELLKKVLSLKGGKFLEANLLSKKNVYVKIIKE